MEDRALCGVRVADFSWAVATPYASFLLALMGAEVIKIESGTRLDLMRIMPRTQGWADAGIEESLQYTVLNAGKLGVTINLSKPHGVGLARQIVALSDVVTENFRPGVMDRLGLGYEALRQVRPDIIMLSSSSFGSSGPEAHYLGYAPTFGALSGLSHLTGYEDDSPAEIRSPGDLMPASAGGFAVMAALWHRDRTGEGQHVDFSCTETLVCTVGDAIMDYTMNEVVETRCGNRDELMAPHNCYPCRGEDKWISIAVGSDEEWANLCRTIGHPEWAHEPRFADSYARWQHQEELDRLIAEWTRDRDGQRLMEALQAAGVAAALSVSAEEIFSDEHLRERGVFGEVEHPALGKPTIYAGPWRCSQTPPRVKRGGPLLGEHNGYIFGELLGLSAREIGRLVEEEVIC